MFKIRYGGAILASMIITIALFLFMSDLVKSDAEEEVTSVEGDPIVIGRIVTDTGTPPKDRKPDEPVQKKAPPPPKVDSPKVVLSDHGGEDILKGFSGLDNPGELVPPTHDGQAILMVGAPPIFPSRAKTGGWVILQFDISPDGQVINPEVVEKYPSSVFDQSAMRAIRGWKFKPKRQDGKAVWQYGMQYQITYEFDEET